MTREEAIHQLQFILDVANHDDCNSKEIDALDEEAINMAIKTLEKDPKTGYCKDCEWWKDSDGVYRRGVGAESQCPINRREVFEGTGYCYMYEPQESEG